MTFFVSYVLRSEEGFYFGNKKVDFEGSSPTEKEIEDTEEWLVLSNRGAKSATVLNFMPWYEPVIETPIEDLGLSNRAHNSLKRYGIYTVEMLCTKRIYDLNKVRGLGKGCIWEIRKALYQRGLHLVGEKGVEME